MVPVVTTCGMRLDGLSYFHKWHEFRWLQLLISVALDWMGTITTMGGIGLYGYSYYYKWHQVRWLQLLLHTA
jgi:hypothetical protein